MRAICITLPENAVRADRAMQHFGDAGLNVRFIRGINGYKTGLVATHTYDHDHPGTGYVIGPATIGIYLSHFIAWSIVAAGDFETMLILEDDAILRDDFKQKLNQAIMDADVSGGWDMLFLGSCCTDGHHKIHVAGDVWHMTKVQCLHAYIVTKHAAQVLLANCQDVYAPIDCLLNVNAFFGLKVFAVLPRIAHQVNTELPP